MAAHLKSWAGFEGYRILFNHWYKWRRSEGLSLLFEILFQ
jgi:hypothetical protein